MIKYRDNSMDYNNNPAFLRRNCTMSYERRFGRVDQTNAELQIIENYEQYQQKYEQQIGMD